MVCLPALIRSGSSSPSNGKGPMPSMPFSDCKVTLTPAGISLATSVGMPMPRFTYQPSCNSRPARSAIWLRSHILRFLLASRAVFDALFVFALNDAVHIDARQVDGVGIKAAQRHDFFHLHNADLTGGRGGRVEVARRLAEHKVARGIGLPRLYDG